MQTKTIIIGFVAAASMAACSLESPADYSKCSTPDIRSLHSNDANLRRGTAFRRVLSDREFRVLNPDDKIAYLSTVSLCDMLIKGIQSRSVSDSLAGNWFVSSSYTMDISETGVIEFESLGIVPDVELSEFRGGVSIESHSIVFTDLLRHAENAPIDVTYTELECRTGSQTHGSSIALVFWDKARRLPLDLNRDVPERLPPRCLRLEIGQESPEICEK